MRGLQFSKLSTSKYLALSIFGPCEVYSFLTTLAEKQKRHIQLQDTKAGVPRFVYHKPHFSESHTYLVSYGVVKTTKANTSRRTAPLSALAQSASVRTALVPVASLHLELQFGVENWTERKTRESDFGTTHDLLA